MVLPRINSCELGERPWPRRLVFDEEPQRRENCSIRGMDRPLQRIVYILKNHETPPRYYTGLTSNLAGRLNDHNGGRCAHTAKYRPWLVDAVVKFADERRAVVFEKYLKSGSGVEFARRHLR